MLCARSRVFGALVLLLTASAACENGSSGDKGSSNAGGSAGTAPSGGSAGAAGAAATGGTGPTGGASGAATGGSQTGGAAGSSGGTAPGGSAGAAGSNTTGGSAGSAGSSGAGASGDPCARAIFCDDFDEPALNSPPATPWTVDRGGSATAVIDGTHRMSGAQSVKFTVPTGPGRAYIALRNAPVFPLMGNAFYGRAMMWLEAGPTASVHWTIVEASGLVPSQTYHSAYRLGGQHPLTSGGPVSGSQLMANYETPDGYSGNGPRSDCWHHATDIVMPTARWSCVEWRYDGPSNALTMWVDGTQVLEVLGMGNAGNGDGCVSQPASYPWTAPTFDTLRLGWESYQADNARTLWLDDVAIATERVGCPSGTGQ